MMDVEERELAWQAKWRAAGLATPRRDPARGKFFVIFAYPGTSGFMHLGHMRGFCYADVMARLHRMRGEEVFFPVGAHASGLPAVIFAERVARRDPDTVEGLVENGATPEMLPALEDPAAASRFLASTYLRVYERFGLLVDTTAAVSTIDPDYQQFIRWQFLRLQAIGRLVQKPYFAAFCPRSGPVSVDPSETDLARGGNAEIVVYTGLPFALPDGRLLLCATLRPETVYGVTNLWVAPGSRLVEWRHEGRTYLLTDAGVRRMLEQAGGTRGAEVPATTLLALRARAPFTGAEVPILESPLVDPAVGSGVVMSVPAHAPADWVAIQERPEAERAELLRSAHVLLDLPAERLSPSERELFAGEGPPAARAVLHLGVKGLADRARLQEATERAYRAEHAHGVMRVAPFTGQPVQTARQRVAEQALAEHGAVEVREFSEPVVCRCGGTVVVRRVPDQWFLAYGAKDWKADVRAHLATLQVRPPEYARELPGILDWFEDRPAVRQGRWLGTPFPLDPRWVIEPIADSTLYPAYYVVRRFVTRGLLSAEQLTPAFFDRVFRGEGPGEPSVPEELQEEVRRDFLYFYPLDVNLGGKEHKRVHFPPFLFNHLALLPPALAPRGIFVYWWITGRAGKLSKKDVKGGAVPTVDGALKAWGADGIRLYYMLGASPFQDVEWDHETCARAAERAGETLALARSLYAEGGAAGTPPAPPGGPSELAQDHATRWLSTCLADATEAVGRLLESCDFRRAAETVYVEIPALWRRYRARGGSDAEVRRRLADVWGRLLAPMTPHLAEEAAAGHREGLLASAPFPDGKEFPRFPEALAREGLLLQLEEDVGALLKSWRSPLSELRIFVASPWKHEAETALRRALHAGVAPDLGSLMKALRGEPGLRSHLGELPELLKLYDLRALAASPPPSPTPSSEEELRTWAEEGPGLRARFGLGPVVVLPEEGAASSDPKGRRRRARPGRPALYLVEAPPA